MTDETRWQAEDDARTLKRYMEIVADTNRHTMAKKILEEEIEQAQKILGGEFDFNFTHVRR